MLEVAPRSGGRSAALRRYTGPRRGGAQAVGPPAYMATAFGGGRRDLGGLDHRS